jgi:glycosyltransferase involved in cell wall biosynthesis
VDGQLVELCFITTCMGRLAHLQRTLPGALAQVRATHIVVDFSCPQGAGDWVERDHPQVRVVRVAGRQHFNMSEARNAGAAAAQAAWLFFRDADVEVAPGFAAQLLPLLRPCGFYVAVPDALGPLAGAVVCARADLERAGGYDEVMQGWGYEDADLYRRLAQAGLEKRLFPTRLVRAIEHDDAARVANFATKHREISRMTNALYGLAKLRVGAVSGRALELEARRALYRDVSKLMPVLLRDRRRKTVRFDAAGVPGGIRVSIDPATGNVRIEDATA